MTQVSNKDFFNCISVFYDSMVSSRKSINFKTLMLRNFISPNMKNAADIGCGSGNDSIALSLNGLMVKGFDPSTEMIKLAVKNASARRQKIKFIKSPADKIPARFNSGFDIAVSLGNTFANIAPNLLIASFKRINDILSEGGLFVMQIINYFPIINNNERILNITKDKKSTYIRFYDFLDNKVRFNILRVGNSEKTEYSLHSTVLYAHSKHSVSKALRKAGFTKNKFYSGLNKEKFEEKRSRDLVIVAVK